MMNRKLVVLVVLLTLAFPVLAQEGNSEVALTKMGESSGKYWIAAGVAGLIFIGLTVFLMIQERRIKALENKVND